MKYIYILIAIMALLINSITAQNTELWGMTRGSGSNNKGAIYKYDFVTSIYTEKVSFDGTSKGSTPQVG